jgi:hypothetical protein
VQQPEPLGGAGHRDVEVGGVVCPDPLRVDDHDGVELERSISITTDANSPLKIRTAPDDSPNCSTRAADPAPPRPRRRLHGYLAPGILAYAARW